jgi:hypothetical protein
LTGTDLLFIEDVAAIDVVSQISSIEVIHEKVAVFPILEGALHID